MPIIWQNGINPYVHNFFSRLRIGPNVGAAQILGQAKQLKQLLDSGESLAVGDQPLDEHALSEASTKLRLDPKALAEELLLVHPQPQSEGRKLKRVCEELRQVAALPLEEPMLPLVHPLGVFWFTPPPGPEVAVLPPWEDFRLVAPGDGPDLDLDIVFDG